MNDPHTRESLPEWLGIVQSSVETLRFGDIHITVHNGDVVQVTRTETTRIATPRTPSAVKGRKGRIPSATAGNG